MPDTILPGPDGAAVCRRYTGEDRRRRHPWMSDVRYAFNGRRRSLRRVEDRCDSASILDWYGPGLLLCALTVFMLSVTDAVLTLHLIGRGVTTEANPVMQYLLEVNVSAFIGGKMVATGIGVLVLVAYSELVIFGGITMARVLQWVLGFYVLLVAYELLLLELASW